MAFINKAFPGEQAKALVRDDRCDGCALCVDVCPVGALALGANPKRPGRRIALLDGEACRGCGVCQATCPKEAILIPGLSPEELRKYIDAALAIPTASRARGSLDANP
ncbi:MAG: 4Fe-4S binding protein [Desulfocurvibacter africanus]